MSQIWGCNDKLLEVSTNHHHYHHALIRDMIQSQPHQIAALGACFSCVAFSYKIVTRPSQQISLYVRCSEMGHIPTPKPITGKRGDLLVLNSCDSSSEAEKEAYFCKHMVTNLHWKELGFSKEEWRGYCTGPVLANYSHTLHIVCGSSPLTTAQLSRCDRDCMACKSENIYYLALCRKSFPIWDVAINSVFHNSHGKDQKVLEFPAIVLIRKSLRLCP